MCNRNSKNEMFSRNTFFILYTLFALTVAQGEDTCKCSGVVVTSKEELAQHIQSQVTNKIYEKIEALIKPVAEKLSLLEQPGHFPSHPASSCKEIINLEPTTPSGYYWLRASNGTAVRVFCDMTRSCGGVTGGWMKVADLDMTNSSAKCPNALSFRVKNGKPLCARGDSNGGCTSVNYQAHGINYNEVCGKIIGYQQGSTDGAHIDNAGINGPFIDGVTLSHGSRKHIWSFISALHENSNALHSTCVCANRDHPGPSPPSFVGQDYFCDTGSIQHSSDTRFNDDPLWDGAGCGPTNDCCTFHNPPWFYKSLGQGTSDDIEMRVCRDEGPTNEDVYVEKVDIYVR